MCKQDISYDLRWQFEDFDPVMFSFWSWFSEERRLKSLGTAVADCYLRPPSFTQVQGHHQHTLPACSSGNPGK